MLDLEKQPPFEFHAGNLPVVVSFPHNSSVIASQCAAKMTDDGRSSRDTDWYLDRLYDVPELQQANRLVAGFSRYVIDLNRPASGQSLYPGQTTTGLVPETCFDGAAIYSGQPPTESEIADRVDQVWQPYHQKLHGVLQAIQESHGFAVLIEAHSIRSEVPRLFEGQLPDFNIGTNNGGSCHPELQQRVTDVLAEQKKYSHVVNGRFIGGYITRHFGAEQNIHAIQFELSQATYLNEESSQWNDSKATQVQVVFRDIFQAITQWTPPHSA